MPSNTPHPTRPHKHPFYYTISPTIFTPFCASSLAVVVQSVEEKLCEHLERLGLGSPALNVPSTVADVVKELCNFQGGFLEGLIEIEDALTPVIKSIVDTVRNPKTSKRSTRRSFDGIPAAPIQSPTSIAAKMKQNQKPRLFSATLASARGIISRGNSASVIPSNTNITNNINNNTNNTTANSINTTTTVKFADPNAMI